MNILKEPNPKHRAIGILAKTPEPGRVKTRLSPPFSSIEAAEIYSEMLKETIALFTRDFWDVYLFYTGEQRFFRETYPQYQQVEQQGENLGLRIDNALNELLARGHVEVAVIGSDSPDLPTSLALVAFDQLQKSQAVLIPTDDGGYAFIGAKESVSPLLQNIRWSTSEVLADTNRQAQAADIRLSVVNPWRDIDDITDLRTFIERSPASPFTHFVLENYSQYL